MVRTRGRGKGPFIPLGSPPIAETFRSARKKRRSALRRGQLTQQQQELIDSVAHGSQQQQEESDDSDFDISASSDGSLDSLFDDPIAEPEGGEEHPQEPKHFVVEPRLEEGHGAGEPHQQAEVVAKADVLVGAPIDLSLIGETYPDHRAYCVWRGMEPPLLKAASHGKKLLTFTDEGCRSAAYVKVT